MELYGIKVFPFYQDQVSVNLKQIVILVKC